MKYKINYDGLIEFLVLIKVLSMSLQSLIKGKEKKVESMMITEYSAINIW